MSPPCFSALLFGLSTAMPAAGFGIQPIGSFHGEEVTAQDGERWLALVDEGDGVALREVTIRVRAVNDPVFDAPDGRSGREVDVPGLATPPRMLVRGAALRPGRVHAVPLQDHALTPGAIVALDVSGLHSLALRCDSSRPAREALRPGAFPCEVVASGRGLEQVLWSVDAVVDPQAGLLLGSEGSVTLRFVGDLDRDGHADLLLDVSDHYNMMRTRLLLSSQAGAEALLGQAAEFTLTGC